MHSLFLASCWQFLLRPRFSYFSSPSLHLLYLSRNSWCFCRRISVCFLNPLALDDSREDTFGSVSWHQESERAVGLTWPSAWIRCTFLWWLDLSRPWSCCELLPTSWCAKKHFSLNHFTQTWFLYMVKKKERVTWRRRCGLRCWAAWRCRSNQPDASSFSAAFVAALLTCPVHEPDGTAPSNACSPYCRWSDGRGVVKRWCLEINECNDSRGQD